MRKQGLSVHKLTTVYMYTFLLPKHNLTNINENYFIELVLCNLHREKIY